MQTAVADKLTKKAPKFATSVARLGGRVGNFLAQMGTKVASKIGEEVSGLIGESAKNWIAKNGVHTLI